jgi:prephenate dehydrogenase
MGRDMCITNRESIVRWIDRYLQELGRLRDIIASDPKTIEDVLTGAKKAREQWLEERR